MQDLNSSTLVRFEDWTLRVRESSDPDCRLMLMIHGLTGDENSMWVFGRNLPSRYWLVAPRAPHTVESGGYSWRPPFVASEFGRPTLDQLRVGAEGLIHMVDAYAASAGIDAKTFDLVGFSQGGAMSNVLTFLGAIEKQPVVLAAMDFAFIGGSMGSVVGEKVGRAIDRAYQKKTPLLIISSSGGARMMEGAISLMQLAQTSAKLARLADARVPFVSILTDPTTGGVTASYAMLGDINIAEPNALIGFAGPRVIRQTIGKDLPPGFHEVRVPARTRIY